MALEKIVINVSGQADLDSTIKKLTQLGLIDEKNAKQFLKNSKQTQDSIDNTSNKIGSLDGVLKKAGTALAGAFALNKILDFGKAVFDITARFQKFEAVLTNTLGSRSAAQEAMNRIVDFASKTPFSVDELTASFVKLANQGFQPTTAEMIKLGDLASSTGKSFDQLVEAVLDAQTGERERLKEFGITSKIEGDKIAFRFKEETKLIDNNASAVRAYILSLGELNGVKGASAAISKTLEGQLSNLSDTYDSLLLAIGKEGQGGAADAIGFLSSVLSELTKAVEGQESVFDPLKESVIATVTPLQSLYDSIVDLVNQFGYVINAGDAASGTMQFLGYIFKSLTIPIKLTILGIVTLIDSLNILVKSGKNVFNFFKGNKLEDIGFDRLKRDAKQFVDIITFSDGKFEHMTKTVKTGSDEQQKSIRKTTEEVKKLTKEQQKAVDKFKEMHAMRVAEARQLAKINIAQKDASEAIRESEKKDQKERVEIRKEGMKKFQKEVLEPQIKANDKARQEDLDKDYKAIIDKQNADKQAKQILFDTSVDLLNELQNRKNQELDVELKNTEKQTETQIKALERRNKDGLISDAQFAAQKEALQNKQRQKEKVIRLQQAQNEKNQALFNIALNTAVAISKQLATTPLPAGAFLVGSIIASGALQAALVASKPLPQFKKGGFTGEGNPNDTAGIVHKSEFVMPADKTAKYRNELDEMYNGKYRKPIKLDRTLTDLRGDNMAENIYKSMMLNGFDDKGIINAISKNNKVKLSNSGELASQIANKISDRNSEGRLYA